jgi:ubiquinone/menaquinone biosynthesis C-methylase UbiE
METSNPQWRIWDSKPEYGELLYKRAVGELPEMESSKAVARILQGWIQPDHCILDVGCGSGHYLKSLHREINTPFAYVGVDATSHYIHLAREAWQNAESVRFEVADIYSLPFDDSSFDVVISCNLLLHLPSIKKPISELIRVSRKKVLIRTLIGERSFLIKEVQKPPRTDSGTAPEEFDELEDPRYFNYYNIYSMSRVENLVSANPKVKTFTITPDQDFNIEDLKADLSRRTADNTTRLVDGWQLNGYILQPWQFVMIDVNE